MDSKKIPKHFLVHPYFVPYHSLNHHGLLSCIKIRYLEMNQKRNSQYLVGVSHGKLFQNGVDCILNQSCLEELL